MYQMRYGRVSIIVEFWQNKLASYFATDPRKYPSLTRTPGRITQVVCVFLMLLMMLSKGQYASIVFNSL